MSRPPSDKGSSGRNAKPNKTSSSSAADDEQGAKKKNPPASASASGGAGSPRNSRRSPNKIYRTPPTPPPEELHVKEHKFVLDCIAVNTTSVDYGKVNPKLGQVIPPYNAHDDRSVDPYFQFIGVKRTLKETGQEPPGTSMEGPVIDRFYKNGAGYRYLSLRNRHGAGHSSETIDGHAQFQTGLQPIDGYNGPYGYRRNNPWLRRQPSTFGVVTELPLH